MTNFNSPNVLKGNGNFFRRHPMLTAAIGAGSLLLTGACSNDSSSKEAYPLVIPISEEVQDKLDVVEYDATRLDILALEACIRDVQQTEGGSYDMTSYKENPLVGEWNGLNDEYNKIQDDPERHVASAAEAMTQQEEKFCPNNNAVG